MMHTRLLSITTLLLASLLLGACGFQLRGAQSQLPEYLQPLHVSGVSEGSDFGRALRMELEIAGAQLSDTQAGANYQLRILRIRPERRVLSIDPRARAAEIILTEDVEFELRDREGNIHLGASAQERRVMLDDPDRRTDKASEERSLREGMIRELAARIVRQLRSATQPQEP